MGKGVLFGVDAAAFMCHSSDCGIRPYDFASVPYGISSLSDGVRDKSLVVEWYGASREVGVYPDDTAAIVIGSTNVANALGSEMMRLGFDAGEPAFWERLRALSCAATLRACLCGRFRGIADAPTFVRDVCALLQLCIDAVLQRPYGVDTSLRNSAGLVLDFACGRGAGWTRVLATQARACALYRGSDVDAAQISVGGAVMSGCVSEIMSSAACDVGEASRRFGSEIVRVAERVDEWQSGIACDASRGRNALGAARDWSLWRRFGDIFEQQEALSQRASRGPFSALGLDATRACVCLTPEFEAMCAKTYMDVRHAEVAAARRPIDVSGLT